VYSGRTHHEVVDSCLPQTVAVKVPF
jgi:hypothetical protein